MALSTVVPDNPIGIKGMFTTKNPTFSNPTMKTKKALFLHSTATPGAPAQNFFSVWNSVSAGASVEFVVDDTQILQFLPIGKNGVGCIKSWHCGSGPNGSCNATHIATEMCEPIQAQLIPINYQEQGIGVSYPRTYSITRIQMELTARGYLTGTPDGKFGPNTEGAVKRFQADNGLSQTGKVNKTTLAKLASRPGSYAAYDVEGATPFFNACYNNTIKLFAWLCGYVGAKPSEVLCHCEGYQRGVSSNHSDVMHWFVYHNKTMDDFRRDLQDAVNGKWVPLGTKPAKSEYVQNVEKVAAAGIINSADYWVNLETNNEKPNANFVWALLRQTGQYFCMKDAGYAVSALKAVDLPSEAQADQITVKSFYSLLDIKKILVAGALISATDGCNWDTEWNDLVNHLVHAGIINTPSAWLDLTQEKVNPANVNALIKKLGAYACTLSYSIAIEVLVDAIKMNSPDYWNGGDYSTSNLKFYFAAVAANL